MSKNLKTRVETDSLGEIKVPKDALWGAQTQRAIENFPISGIKFKFPFGRSFLKALGVIKYSAEYLITPKAFKKERPKGNLNLIPLIGKFSIARCVCAPHNASFGTLISPRLSVSTLVFRFLLMISYEL